MISSIRQGLQYPSLWLYCMWTYFREIHCLAPFVVTNSWLLKIWKSRLSFYYHWIIIYTEGARIMILQNSVAQITSNIKFSTHTDQNNRETQIQRLSTLWSFYLQKQRHLVVKPTKGDHFQLHTRALSCTTNLKVKIGIDKKWFGKMWISLQPSF